VQTIGRSDNIDDCSYANMDWDNDALTLYFGATKSDQAGERTSDVKRIFANPFQPAICVILKLAVHVFCNRRNENNHSMRVFDGHDQNKRYFNILQKAVKNIPAEILGCAPSDIGKLIIIILSCIIN